MVNEKLVTILGAGTVVGQRARWDGTSWVPVTQGLDLIAESVDPTAATSLTLSGLNGDADILYEVMGRILKDASTGHVTFQLNADATAGNHAWANVINYSGTITGGASVSDTQIYYEDGTSNQRLVASDHLDFFFRLFAKSGVQRRLLGRATARISNGSLLLGYDFIGEWKNTSTNLTSIKIISGAGNIGGLGSFIRAYRILD